MSVSPGTEWFMEQAWNRVIASTRMDPSQLHLLPISGAAVVGHNQAACYPPSCVLLDEPDDLLRGAILVEANLPCHRDKHRIAIYEDVDPADSTAVAIMAAKLRHEVRHACGQHLFDLDDLAQCLASWKVGDLPGGAALYHHKPIELDANAASASFLRQHYPDEVGAILDGGDGVLARSKTPPGDLLDLPAKTVAFMFGLREVAEDPTRSSSGLTFANRLGQIHPRCRTLWEALVASRLE